VLVDDEAKQATVIVPDDQLSLAIGREGQNARLAARLTGWRVDIRSETEFAAEEAEHGYEEEEAQGRCAAILSNGRRCPNASLPGSRYCGLETHQALASITTDNIVDLAGTDAAEAPAADAPQEPADAGTAAVLPPAEAAQAQAATEAAAQDSRAADAQTATEPATQDAHPAGAQAAREQAPEVASLSGSDEQPAEQKSPAAEERAT
jgi:N utilization substance protein A